MMDPKDFPERVQLSRSWCPEEPVPGVGADPYDTGQPAVRRTKSDTANESGKITTRFRTAESDRAPAFIVTTRKMAARVSRASTACDMIDGTPSASVVAAGITEPEQGHGVRNTANPTVFGCQATGNSTAPQKHAPACEPLKVLPIA